MKKPKLPKPHKVGDIVNENGVEMQVMAADKSKEGHFILYKMSAEPIAKRKGYITNDQILGAKIEHYPPPFVPHGARRDPATLKESDWNFVELMKRPLEEKKVALFHELARESARVRLACNLFSNPPDIVKRINDAEGAGDFEFKVMQKWKVGEWKAKQAHEEAQRFLERTECRYPYGAGEMMAELVAKDTGWNELSDEQRADVMKLQEAIESQRVKHEGRTNKDVPCGGPGWPYDDAIQFAKRHWQELKSEWPEYGYNDGKPGRMVLAPRRNGSDAPLVLSESLELCVCLNFSDDELLNSFRKWLHWRRKNLHDDLSEFRQGEGVGLRTDSSRIDAAFKAIAALRLRAKFSSKKEAAITFRDIYEAKRSKKKTPEAAPLADVKKLADAAVKLGQEFLPNCSLDSAPVNDPRKRAWVHLCSNCGKLQRREPDKEPNQKRYTRWRCRKCDHRESSRWDGKEWILCED